MLKRKSLRISSRDTILLRWIELASKDEPDMKKVKYLIKQAVVSYIRDRKFIEIGRIHYDPSNLKDYESVDMVLWVKDSKILVEWLESLSRESVNSGAIVREILRKSIRVVPESEEEWIPEYFDFDDYRFNLEKIPLVTVNDSYSGSGGGVAAKELDSRTYTEKESESSSFSSNDVSRDVMEQREGATLEEHRDTFTSRVVEKPKETGSRRKASGLSGIRIKKE